MNLCKNVLIVTNAATESELAQIKAAINHQQDFKIKMNLVHVIPSLPTCYFNLPSTTMLAEQYYEEAENCLATVGDLLNVDKKDQWLITGRIKTEVLRLAHKLNVNFILAGSISVPELHDCLGFRKTTHSALVQSMNSASLF